MQPEQSKQERRRIAETCGGASTVNRFGGLLPMSLTGTNWMPIPANTSASNRKRRIRMDCECNWFSCLYATVPQS